MTLMRAALGWGILIGIGAGAINQLFIHFTVRPYTSSHLLFPDNIAYFRPSVNFFYNGTFSMVFDSLQLSRLSPLWKAYIQRSDPQATCLAPSGNYPGNLVWTVPFIATVNLLGLDLAGAEKMYDLIWFFLSVYVSPIVISTIFILVGLILLNEIGGSTLVYFLSFLLGFSYVFFYHTINIHINASSLSHVTSFLFLALYVANYRGIFLFIALIFSAISYFMNWRFASVILPFIFVSAYLSIKNRNLVWLSFFAFIFSLVQVRWSYHVYEYTCRWALTHSVDHLGYTDCRGHFPSSCAFPTSKVTHYTIPMLKFEIDLFHTLALPHIHDRPRRIKECINQSANCLPGYIRRCGLSDSIWTSVVSLYKCTLDSSYSDSVRASCAYTLQKEIDGLISELRSKCKWLPIYRALRVFGYNVFHPSPAFDSGQSRYEYASWVRELYYTFQQVYVAIAYLGGLLAMGLGGWGWFRGWFQDWRERVWFLLLIVYGFGPIVVPCLVGASEWRYFFPGIPFLYLLVGWMGLVVFRRWRGRKYYTAGSFGSV